MSRQLEGRLLPAVAAFAATIALAAPAVAAVEPHPGMLRDPDVGPTHIVFSYAQDLWLVPRDGGTARPLASPEGSEMRPRFSDDGKTIAFVGNYDGNRDLYTVPVEGGVPYRVTHHPSTEVLNEWAPDGRLLFFFNGLSPYPRITELYTVSAEGGMPDRLPVPWGSKAAIDATGEWLAYTPHTRDQRTWKRYRGGMATDIWLFNLKTMESERATTWEGTDTEPMWHDGQLYYLSDRGPAHRLNVWVYDPVGDAHEQLTRFEDYDIKYASIGPGDAGQGEIVLQNGPALYLLDLQSGDLTEVEVTIPGDRPTLREQRIDASRYIQSWSISATGKRAVVSARGDVWTLPREHGTPRNLTRSNGSAERYPAWSPDGKHVAYFSDASGEYELYLTQSDGRGETKQLTEGEQTFYFEIDWSPKSDKLAFTDKAARLFVYDVESGEAELIDEDPWATRPDVAWSPDGRYLAYDRSLGSGRTAIFLHDFESGERHQLTSGMFEDADPVFDRDGKYLVFKSGRRFSPIYSAVDTSFIYADTQRLMLVPLTADQDSPFAPEYDAESWDDGEEEEGKEQDAGEGGDEDGSEESESGEKKAAENGEEEDAGVEIDVEGFAERAEPIDVDAGTFGTVAFNDKGHLLYGRLPMRGEDADGKVVALDLTDDDLEEKPVVEGTGVFDISADGKQMLYPKRGAGFIQPAMPGGMKKAKKVVTDGMEVLVDPREEWEQIFVDAWRRYRNFFYDPTMHGVDWEGIREQYAPMLDDCVTRSDVGFVIREMISELNVGHAYYRGTRPMDPPPRMSVGLLGVDFELHEGAYRIAEILRGGPWDSSAVSPLDRPGVDVSEGDYVLAVNGQPIDTEKDPWASFQGLAGKTVELTVSGEPQIDDQARQVVVELLGSEVSLRYRAWVESNRQYVEEKSDGKIGYVYVPNTGVQGQNELVRQYFGQIDKQALLIDERWNGGGQIPTRFIEMLNRPITNYWARRHGKDWPWPPDAHHGPKAMLINGLAGSGGDAFPFYFRQAGLGALIGTRTWGGLVGITGMPPLVDGAAVTVPNFAFYEKDGTWGIEGHGVEPDIEVLADPAEMVDGSDPQLDAAIDHLLEQIEENPYQPPERPEYPDRSGWGIEPENR